MGNLSGFVKRLRDIMRNDAGINGDAQRLEQIAWLLFLKVYDSKEQDWEWEDEDFESILPEECRWRNWAADDKSGTAMTGDALLNFVSNTLFPTLKSLPVDASTPKQKAVVRSVFEDTNSYMKDGVLLRQVINVIDELDFSDYEEIHAFGEIYEAMLRELQSAGSSGEFYTPRAVTDFMAKMIQPKIGEHMADFACGTGGFIASWLKELRKLVRTTDDERAWRGSVYGIEKKQFPYILCVTNMFLQGLDLPNIDHMNSLVRDVLDYTAEDQVDVALMNPPYGGSEKAEIKNHFPADLASSETADLFLSVIMYRLKEGGRAAVIQPDGFLFGTDNAKLNIKKKLLREFNLHTVVRMPGSVFSPYTSITTNILFFDRTGPTRETWFYRLDMPEGYKHFSKTKPMKLEHFDPVVEWWNDRKEIAVDGFDKAKKYAVEQLTGELGYNLDQCGYPHEEEEILAPLDLIRRYEEQRASLNAEIDRTINRITAILDGKNAHEAYTIHDEHAWSRLTSLNECFPEDIKKSILQLAIQGKLVEQRPEEGTAEELYQQIQAERFKTEKPLPEIKEEEKPFEIPESWKWVRLKDIATLYNGRAYKQQELLSKGKYAVLRVGNLFTSNKWYYSNLELEEEKYCQAGDLLYAWSASFGPHIWEGAKTIYHYHIWKIDYSKYVFRDFLYYLLLADTENLKQSGHGLAMIHITKAGTEERILPLPPLAEQKRIVAKLEELLPLCDKLK